MPFGAEKVASRQSMRVRQLDLDVETKTHDDVFVINRLAVQYMIPNKDKVYDAYYKLADHTIQMNSWVFDVVRSKVPTMKLDNVFENKDEIADEVKKALQERMAQQILGGDARSKVIFLPSSPGASGDFMNQTRVAFSSAMETQTDMSPIPHRETEK